MASLEEVLASLKPLAEEAASRGARVFAVFGSAARGADFIPCRSDVDVLVVFEGEHGFPDRLLLPGLGVDVSLAAYTVEELEKLVEATHPVLLHLYKASVVLLDDGTLADALARIPRRIPRSTIEIEEKSTVAALALGLERLALDDPEAALDHVHHALRHLARAAVGEGRPVTLFPAYDVEVEAVLEQLDPGLPRLLRRVAEARRRCRASVNEASEMLEKAWSAAAEHLGLEVPRLEKVLEACSRGAPARLEVPVLVDWREGRVEIMCGATRVKP